ncbi:small G protein signaling modulator 1 isoform X2 [Neltuma alba]|uniref:small G protein signaling modulator 1 isoform X2 n=1 Tax=Neltuma alba TaxID=207710 RepID=UPI0010A582F4|nr:small G protein signaling modulator 1-like isoform X2 [Prosopis alba]
MYCSGENKQWSCGKAGTMNLQKVSSILRDIGDPCLSQSPAKVVIIVNRMLKPDKWQATFDSEGKVFGFPKALKLIVLGGIDPSIRAEVWEFLLGCYALGSTAEYRRRLREARRERYRDLVTLCQTMHSSVGTGSLAYIVGSKVMDMRTLSRDDWNMKAQVERSTANDNNFEGGKCCDRSDKYTDAKNAKQQENSSDWDDLVSLRSSLDGAAHDSSGPQNCNSVKLGEEAHESFFRTDSYFDFPPLPVTNLFEKSGEDNLSCMGHDLNFSGQHNSKFEDDRMHSFAISNNVDLVIESNDQQLFPGYHPVDSEIGIVSTGEHEPEVLVNNSANEAQLVNQLRIVDVPQPTTVRASITQGRPANEDRVSEWLWTLHRIVVDVVRTDSHLDFYEDTRNLARMSDILAVYAWVDPATGYCQGMSDLLSPFVVLFEDNADAFWCFEMLIRRMRENFQMEGPTGVMRQLQELWHVLELTDREIFAHLSRIGAESLHFAFPMLLVLFRRELSFNEALSMWEMMWAADFDESLVHDLEEKCLEALVIKLPEDSGHEIKGELANTNDGVRIGSQSNNSDNDSCTKTGLQSNHGNIDHSLCDVKLKSLASHTFCGLTRNFWSRNAQIEMSIISSLSRKENEELPIFCVAAILVINRQKIIRETHSFDDMIKMFNDKMLKINVKSAIRMAIKLRKKYLNKVVRRKSHVAQEGCIAKKGE